LQFAAATTTTHHLNSLQKGKKEHAHGSDSRKAVVRSTVWNLMSTLHASKRAENAVKTILLMSLKGTTELTLTVRGSVKMIKGLTGTAS